MGDARSWEANGVIVLERDDEGGFKAPKGLSAVAALLQVQEDTIIYLENNLEEVRDDTLEALSRVRQHRNEHGRDPDLDKAAEILDDIWSRLEAYSS